MANKVMDKINNFEGFKNQEDLNKYTGSYEEKIKKCIEDSFKKTLESYEKIDNKSLKCLSLSGETFRKRKKVLEKYAPIARGKYALKYPRISPEYEFIALNTTPTFANYDRINEVEFIFQAAALYVLYDIENHGKIDKLKEILPKDEEAISMAIVHPEAKDLCFSDEFIGSLVSLFQSQNEYKPKVDQMYILTKNYTEGKIKNALVTSEFSNDKEKVLYILNLVDKYNIETSVARFKDDCWRLVELCLKFENSYQESIETNDKKMTEIIQQLEKACCDKNNVLLVNEDEETNPLKVRQLADSLNELIDINDVTYNAKQLLRIALNMLYFDDCLLEEDIEENIKDEIRKFEIADPYETAFAFVYLLSTDDDFIWLINICSTILKVAAEKLPWTKDVNYNLENNEKEIKQHEERIKSVVFNEESNRKFEDEERAFLKDFYSLKYNDAYHWEDVNNANEGDLLKWNLAQFIFDYTHIIMPRNIASKENCYEGLIKSNFKKEELYMLSMLMEALDLYQCRETLMLDTDKEEEETKEEFDLEQLKVAIKKKNEKINSLQNNLKDLNSKFKDLKKEYNLCLKEKETNIDELYRLREQIYNIQNENEFTEDTQIKKVDFPYTAKKRTVVIGGSDTWINKMKEKLNNVSFMSSSVKLNIDLLKSAEVVWIQTIAMKHADFYALTSFNDKQKLPIHYFSFSNIEKCLKQFIKEDI